MKAIKKAAVLTATTCALVLASAAGASADAGAQGVAAASPGVLSGNVVQIPINLPISLCGNAIDIVGLLNPTAGNTCAGSGGALIGHDMAGGDSSGTMQAVNSGARQDAPAPHANRPAPHANRPAAHRPAAHRPMAHRPARHHVGRLAHHRLHRVHRLTHRRPAHHQMHRMHHR
jgi:hypothetical protein